MKIYFSIPSTFCVKIQHLQRTRSLIIKKIKTKLPSKHLKVSDKLIKLEIDTEMTCFCNKYPIIKTTRFYDWRLRIFTNTYREQWDAHRNSHFFPIRIFHSQTCWWIFLLWWFHIHRWQLTDKKRNSRYQKCKFSHQVNSGAANLPCQIWILSTHPIILVNTYPRFGFTRYNLNFNTNCLISRLVYLISVL